MSDTYSIGVDLGETNLRVAAYAEGDSFLESLVMLAHLFAGRDQVIQDTCEAIAALMSCDNGDRSLAGIAI